MREHYKKSEWGLLVANADLQLAAGTCPFIFDEAIVWANNRIKALEKALADAFQEYNSTGHLSTRACLKAGLLLSDQEKEHERNR